MIKLQIIGNIGKDCIVNTVNGKNVINFTVAHTESFKDAQGNKQEKTTWVEAAYWTDRTAIAPYLIKGSKVYVEGKPEVKSFQRNDGTPGASMTLRVDKVELLGSKPANTASTGSGTGESKGVTPSEIIEPIDDLPF